MESPHLQLSVCTERWNAGMLTCNGRAQVQTDFAASGVVYLAFVSIPTAEEIRNIHIIGRQFCEAAAEYASSSATTVAHLNEELAGASLNLLLLLCTRWIPMLASKPDGPCMYCCFFFEILQRITDTALKMHR